MNGAFTAVIAGSIILALFGLVPVDQLLILFAVGAAGKHIGAIQ